MNDDVKVTIKISVPPAKDLVQWLAAARLVREDAPQLVEYVERRFREGLHVAHVSDTGHCHTINDPGHSHGLERGLFESFVVDQERERMARNLTIVRPLPCDRE
ncbi:hypothetical protein [Paraburkholderia humisilvae]|uniref:Uncharacterized protein n=1 Tax=Paraburkholderia humisilvae TaxID=627669 RepID=A0A6J5DXY3_9BURK|nr:hypothetical protein [Paraburkholderia humisilvae]CAB3758497.1 hypothetical protein LMG29542_03357 [Paraburkholderia humisilvae]